MLIQKSRKQIEEGSVLTVFCCNSMSGNTARKRRSNSLQGLSWEGLKSNKFLLLPEFGDLFLFSPCFHHKKSVHFPFLAQFSRWLVKPLRHLAAVKLEITVLVAAEAKNRWLNVIWSSSAGLKLVLVKLLVCRMQSYVHVCEEISFVCLKSDAIELPATFTASSLSLVCVCVWYCSVNVLSHMSWWKTHF